MQWKYPSLSKLKLQKLSPSECRDLHSTKNYFLKMNRKATATWKRAASLSQKALGLAPSLEYTSLAKCPPQRSMWGLHPNTFKDFWQSLLSAVPPSPKHYHRFFKNKKIFFIGSFTKEAIFSFQELL